MTDVTRSKSEEAVLRGYCDDRLRAAGEFPMSAREMRGDKLRDRALQMGME